MNQSEEDYKNLIAVIHLVIREYKHNNSYIAAIETVKAIETAGFTIQKVGVETDANAR
jgi:hypothetical protein